MKVICASSPARSHANFVSSASRVLGSEPALFRDDDDRRKTAALLTAIAFRESSLDLRAVGDKGRSVCWMQILNGDRALLEDGDACLRRGMAMVRESFKACAHLPPDERLALYARGRCDSEEGRKISRERHALASWMTRSVKP